MCECFTARKYSRHKREVIDFRTKARRKVPAEQHIVKKNTHEQIVPVALWNAVQEARKGRSTPKKTKRSPELNLFAGFVYCADCGGVLAATKKGNKSVEYDLLRCARYNNGGKNACSSHSIRYDALNDLVLEDIKRYTRLAEEDEQALIDSLYRQLIEEEQADVRAREKKSIPCGRSSKCCARRLNVFMMRSLNTV
ncbi:MAG: recombinase zinc beta ribbon domain-containing protein [Oscillospiraceae bacterium]